MTMKKYFACLVAILGLNTIAAEEQRHRCSD